MPAEQEASGSLPFGAGCSDCQCLCHFRLLWAFDLDPPQMEIDLVHPFINVSCLSRGCWVALSFDIFPLSPQYFPPLPFIQQQQSFLGSSPYHLVIHKQACANSPTRIPTPPLPSQLLGDNTQQKCYSKKFCLISSSSHSHPPLSPLFFFLVFPIMPCSPLITCHRWEPGNQDGFIGCLRVGLVLESSVTSYLASVGHQLVTELPTWHLTDSIHQISSNFFSQWNVSFPCGYRNSDMFASQNGIRFQ